MTVNRAFVSTLTFSPDGLIGGAIVENDLSISSKLSLVGQIKEAGEPRWVELHCNIISRGGNAKRKRSRYLQQEKGKPQ